MRQKSSNPTVRDVAKAAGVSVSTVSSVLNQSKYVSPELKTRVEAAIRELNYRPSRLGRALSLGKSYTLGFIVPTIANPFFPSVVKSVEDVALERGYGLFVCSTEGDPSRVEKYQELLLAAHVDGVILTLTSELALPSVYEPFLERGAPVVGLAGARTIPAIDCVVTDDTRGAADMARHLLALGHRRIGYVGVRESRSTQLRLAGARRAIAEAVGTAATLEVRLGEAYTQGDGYRLARSLLELASRPTALMCYNDVMAVGALRAASDLGLSVPRDVSVVGYDGTLSDFTVPRLTTMKAPTGEMGRRAAGLLLERLDGGSDAEPKVHTFSPALHVQDSSGPPPR